MSVSTTLTLFSSQEQIVMDALSSTFKELRETLHREGRLSSRNEALDELSKILYAHFKAEGGLTRASLGIEEKGTGAAIKFEKAVNDILKKHMPSSLSYEMSLKEFVLKMAIPSDSFAISILGALEKLPVEFVQADASSYAPDILNSFFGQFLTDSFANEKELGQYLTPSEVVRFMVQLAIAELDADELTTLTDPTRCEEFGLIMDPSCGVASFLAEMIRELEQRPEIQGIEVSDWLLAMLSKVIVGVDKSERMVRLALTNLSLFGYNAAQLHLCNSLARKDKEGSIMNSFEGRVKIIVTNPPFGAEFSGSEVASYKVAKGVKANINSEVLFIERYIDWLMPGGQLLAVVPDSILTNKGVYQKLREQLAGRVQILNVISLPDSTFMAAGTNAKTSILHLKKLANNTPPDGSLSSVAVCNEIGFVVKKSSSQRRKETVSEGDLPAILHALITKEPSPLVISKPDIEHNTRWDAQYHASVLHESFGNLEAQGEYIKVRDIASLVNEKVNPLKMEGPTFKYIEISGIDPLTHSINGAIVPNKNAPSRARKLVRGGDVLVSTVRPEHRNIAVVDDELDGAVCTTGLAILRPHGINPLLLARLLASDVVTSQIVRHTAGIAFPAVEEKCLLDLILPLKPADVTRLADVAQRVIIRKHEYLTTWAEFKNELALSHSL